MDLLSTDPDRPGIFAFGQVAYGIFALGQVATGVVAIGQLARGVIAIGQGAVGFIAIGQGAIGVFYAGGMMAVGARGFGFVLKVLPSVVIERFLRPKLPPLSALSDFDEARRGWLLARLRDGSLRVEGEPATVQLSDEASQQLQVATAAGHNFACITVEVHEQLAKDRGSAYREAAERNRRLVGKRLSSWYEGPPRLRTPGPLTGLGGLLLRSVGMVLLVAAWWLLAGADVARLFH